LILAAGLGTRLRPITEKIPKALVEVDGKTLLEHAVDHLKTWGIEQIIINVHHLPGQIVEFLRQHQNFGLEIALSDETDQLLDTGGGLKKAGWFFTGNDPFIVRNVDVLSNTDLGAMIGFHVSTHALATLAVRIRETSRYLMFDDEFQLCGWKNLVTGQTILTRPQQGNLRNYAFSGIQVISPEIFSQISEEGRFSLIDLYLRLSAGQRIVGYPDEVSAWRDAGKK